MPHDPFLARKVPGMPALAVVGTMNFGARTTEAESLATIDHALELGLVCFDTANMYANGAAERLLGRALASVPNARIATKTGLFPIKGKAEGLAPEQVLRSVSDSLERLRRDQVDLLYLHAPDRRTPIDETLGAVKQLVDEGRVKHFGVSNFAAWEVLELMLACDRIGLPRPRVSQVVMNVAIRQVEIEYLRFAARYDVHTTVYNPLAGGLFARELSIDDAPPKGSRFDGNARYQKRYWSERFFRLKAAIASEAGKSGLAAIDVAYGWLAQHAGVDSIIAGPSQASHLDAVVKAVSQPLPESLLAAVSAAQAVFDGTDATYAR